MNITERIAKQRAKIAKAIAKIESIREECDHIGVHVKYDADTGNYCKQDDSYWIYWRCPICDKYWTTDQDREAGYKVRELKAVKI
jgi:hypothetical protein